MAKSKPTSTLVEMGLKLRYAGSARRLTVFFTDKLWEVLCI